MSSARPGVLCAMSGGVDSAIAAALLVEAGFEVIGVTFRIGGGAGAEAKGCCSARHACDAALCAERLGIPHFVEHVEEAFHREVVARFRADYAEGLTPNPCIECNRRVRFPALLEVADRLGLARIATGHYARIRPSVEGWPCLARGVDPAKDQSYVLYALGGATLARLELPLGGLRKSEVREAARRRGLAVAEKPESQDICFVPDGDYRDFLLEAGGTGAEPGPIVDSAGRELGRHEGTWRYTVGQRRGLGVSAPTPLYVLGVDPASRTVTVGPAEELLVEGLSAVSPVLSSVSAEALAAGMPARVQTRAHGEAHPARVSLREGALAVSFLTPTRRVAPGQSIVCYDWETDQVVLAGGVAD